MPDCKTAHYDICIIGAGPAGLSVLSALHNPTRLLTDIQLQTRDLSNVDKGTSILASQKRNSGARGSNMNICVIDPAKSWLQEWKGRGEVLNIEFLRSPAFLSPDYNNNAAITHFASKNCREDELKDVEIPRDASKELRSLIDAGLFKLPSSALFNDFCDEIVKSLPHTFISSCVNEIKKRGDGAYDVIFGAEGILEAKHVIFALGPSCTTKIPRQLDSVYEQCKRLTNNRMIHSFSWQDLQSLPLKQETVVIVGGGLSAIQAANLASQRGSRRVILLSRRKLRARLYDLSIEWFNTRAGWRAHNQKREGCKKFRMYEFYDTPKCERREWSYRAKDGATIPNYYLDEFNNSVKEGKIDHFIDEIEAGELISDGKVVALTLRQNRAEQIFADRVILATGSNLDVNGVPLLMNITENFKLPLVDGLPDLDEDLQWGEENFSVVGALAMMQIGPEAGNLSGCRRCAERCASSLGVHDSMYKESGPLTNIFEVFASSSDEDEDEDEDAQLSVG